MTLIPEWENYRKECILLVGFKLIYRDPHFCRKQPQRGKKRRLRTSALFVSAIGTFFTCPSPIFMPSTQTTPSGLSGCFQLASVATCWGKKQGKNKSAMYRMYKNDNNLSTGREPARNTTNTRIKNSSLNFLYPIITI